MAAPSRTSEVPASENTPLLPTTETNQQNGAGSSAGAKVKKVGRWLADHAIIIFTGLLLAAFIISLSLYFTVYRSKEASGAHPKVPAKDTICDSAACVHASSEILYNLSPDYKTLDPCDDFEKLVCGGWSDRHDLRADQGDAFTGTIMSENSQMLLRHILEAPYPAESNHSSFSPVMLTQSVASIDELNFNKLKAGYDACMDEDTIKDAGVKPLKKIIHQVADMFPIGEPHGKTALLQTKDSEALSETILYLQKLGISSLISLGAGADDKDPDTVVVQAVPPYKIGLVKDYYKDEIILAKYEATILGVFNALYPDPNHASSTKDTIHGLVSFEKKLAAASPDTEDAEDVTKYYNPFSLKDADRLTPQIRLAKLVSSLEPADVKTTRIIVGSPEYMKTMSNVLVSTPKEVIHTFFIWKVIQSFASVVEAEELKPYSRFSNELRGKDPESTPERWRFCVNHVDDSLGWILSRFFVEKAFSAKAKDLGDQIVSDIKEMFIEKLKVSTWMDNSIIDLAIEKVHKIVQKIGYPTKSPDIMDPVSLKRYYQTVEISPSDFFRNALEASRFAVAEEWSALGKPVDRDQWGMTTPTVNAYYNPPGNEIVFPAGIMQFPVFDVNVPQYLSYGAFGAVSGHELSHAFDSTGRHYDQNGNYTDWWNKKTVNGFQERAQCFIDQYHNYTVEGPDGKPLHVNGKLTLGENIADAGGITASFAAWQKRRSETPNQDLPGLEHFTQEQLFFVSYANWWCGKSRKEAAIERIYTDPHAPKWARILGTMANSKDFLQSFNCPAKEPVCELW